MAKDYMTIMILFCIKNLNGERSISAIYHLLKGKKTSQTIQDGKLYRLSQLFGLFPHLTKDALIKNVDLLEAENLIIKVREQSYLITNNGLEELQQQLKIAPIPNELDGWSYHSVTHSFWERLSLLIQTISNLIHSNKQFYPIVNNEITIQWIKYFLLSSRRNKQDLAEKIHHEVFTFLSQISTMEAAIFMLKLTGHKRIGLTFEQIGRLVDQDINRVHVLFYGSLHHFIKQIIHTQDKYPIMYQLLSDIHQPVPLTMSTKKTYQLLVSGKSIAEIAKIRRLKMSTIEDHIVELAHNLNDFSIEPFITTEEREKIEQTIMDLKTNQLKEIKQALNRDVPYFLIRLVLAKRSDRYET